MMQFIESRNKLQNIQKKMKKAFILEIFLLILHMFNFKILVP